MDYNTGKMVGSGIKDQAKQALENIKRTLEENGSDLQHVVKITTYLIDIEEFNEYKKIRDEYFPKPPPATGVEVGSLVRWFEHEGKIVLHHPQPRIEIDVIAVSKDDV